MEIDRADGVAACYLQDHNGRHDVDGFNSFEQVCFWGVPIGLKEVGTI